MSARRWVTAVSLTLVCPVALAQSRPAARVDWPTFLSRQDLVWDRLPTGWGESAFIGNGRLGATIDVHDGVLGWTINRTDVVHDQSRYPIGRVVLKTAGTVQGGSTRLVLWDAEASGTVTTDRGEVRWRSFTASRPSVSVIVLEGTPGESGGARDWPPAEARPPRKADPTGATAPAGVHPTEPEHPAHLLAAVPGEPARPGRVPAPKLGQAPASPHRQRARAAAGGRGGDRTQLGSRSRAPGRSRHGAERRGSRDGGPAMDPVLLLARLSLPDGRPHAARAGLPAAQARDRELPRLRGARRGRALASAAHGVAGARHGARRELRPGAAHVGSRDADRERRVFGARRAAARSLARRAREPHVLSHRFQRADGGPRPAVEGVAPPLLAPAGELPAAPDHTRPPRAACADRGVVAHLGARSSVVPRLLVHRWRVDARGARSG